MNALISPEIFGKSEAESEEEAEAKEKKRDGNINNTSEIKIS